MVRAYTPTTRAFKDVNNNEDQLVRFKKRIDGSVYVVEAVGENKKKRLWLMTAYIQKKALTIVKVKSGSQCSMPRAAPSHTSKTSFLPLLTEYHSLWHLSIVVYAA